MSARKALFAVGQIIHHKMFDYRGVVFDVDPIFQGTDEWYDQVALSRPPKDCPWYHVLIDGFGHRTYVAERNLEPDPSPDPINHPDLEEFFESFDGSAYRRRRKSN
jgi:heat shock protein HspQ